MANSRDFPHLRARNLEGLDVDLPGGFAGERNIVAIAFRRSHQDLVESWVPWFDEHAADDPGLRLYEVPTIGRIWSPARNFIDGSMASAIGDPAVRQRTLTVYGDVTRLTRPLDIDDRSTIAVLLVDKSGRVLCTASGGFSEAPARELEAALAESRRS